jgi:subtilisin family serine protease
VGGMKRKRDAAWFAVCAVVALAALLPPQHAAAAPPADPGGEPLSVIVTLDGTTTVGRVLSALDPGDIRAVERFDSVPGMALEVAPGAVAALAGQPGVVDVSVNRPLGLMSEESAEQMGADDAWAAGLAGAGTTIAIVDTGVDTTHPMLAGKIVAEACFTPIRPGGGGYCPNGQTEQLGAGSAVPCPDTLECGHGTHVAGTAAGDGDGRLGIAHDASVLAVQVFASPSSPGGDIGTDEASVVRALEWLYSQRDAHRIAAVNLSLGGDAVATPCSGSAALLTVLQRLDAAGVAVVAAAGNDGSTARLSFPACLPGVVSVGAVNRNGSVSSFSNTAASLTLLAPGQSIEGPWTSPLPYRSVDGTSFATPHVSAAIAVLRAQLPGWPVSAIVSLLDRTGDIARRGTAGEVQRANAIRLDRAIVAEYQTLSPAALDPATPPFGYLDTTFAAPGGVRVSGWALDADTVEPVTVHVYVDGVLAGTAQAAARRPDVAAAYPGWGSARGFETVVPAADGAHVVCAYGIDLGPVAANSLLGCRQLVRSSAPSGSLDAVEPTFGAVRVAGWAIDPDTVDPVDVHVYVDGVGVAARADLARPDVAAAVPGYGEGHGFDRLFDAGPGRHRVCVYAIDRALTGNVTLGCRDVTVPEPSPFGSLDVVRRVEGGVEVGGWAIDPDTSSSIDVHVYVDGRMATAVHASVERLDVAAARPASGSPHGFTTVVAAPAAARTVCVYGINVDGGGNALIACGAIP